MDLAATMWVPMGSQVPILSPYDHPSHPNPSQRQPEGFRKCGIVENFPVPLCSLNNSNFAAFGRMGLGHMA